MTDVAQLLNFPAKSSISEIFGKQIFCAPAASGQPDAIGFGPLKSEKPAACGQSDLSVRADLMSTSRRLERRRRMLSG